MHFDDPMPTYAHLVTELRDRYPDLAYLHAVEPRADGDHTASAVKEHRSNDFLREIWGTGPSLVRGAIRETVPSLSRKRKATWLLLPGRTSQT